MTIDSSLRRAGPFEGNGIVVEFPFEFKVFGREDVKVTLAGPDGVEGDLQLDVDYTVSLNPNQEQSPGGQVIYPLSGDPLPSRYRLVVTGDLDYRQPTSITNQGGFYPQVIEDALDRATIQIQQLFEELSRAVKVGASSDIDPRELLNEFYLKVSQAIDAAEKSKYYKEQAEALYGDLDAVEQAKLDAQQAREEAQDWAAKMGDPVEGDDWSAKHYAEKSQDHEGQTKEYRDTAKDYRDTAKDYRDTAKDYRDTAIQASAALGIYASKSAGISGTSSGNFFWVAPNEPDGLEYPALFKNSSGSALLIYEHIDLGYFLIEEGEIWG